VSKPAKPGSGGGRKQPARARSERESLLERASRHHRAGELQAAKRTYDEFLALEPERADVLDARGMVALQLGESDAVDFLERAVRSEPTSVPFRVRLAHALRIAGKSEASVDLLTPLVRSHPGDPMLHTALARALSASGNLDDAIAHARQAVDLEASFATLTTLATLLRRRAENDEARVVLERAVAAGGDGRVSKADLATALNDLGLVQEARGESTSARECYERAAELDPGFAGAVNNVGRMQQDAGAFEAALDSFRRALDLGGDRAVVESNLGNSLRALGRLAEAEVAYRNVVGTRPQFAPGHNNLGNALRDLGRVEEAAKAYERAIELDPSYALAISNLGSLRRQLRDYEQAIELFTRARRLDPRLRTPYVSLSTLLAATNQADRLPELFAAWHEHLPDDPIALHMHLATAGSDVAPDRPTTAYVTALFDDFADNFDETLAKLDYHGPSVVTAALRNALSGRRIARILDAGCGTGLCGPLLRSMTDRLEGVDISDGMLAHARRRGVYDDLRCADLIEFLDSCETPYDAIVAADVVNYFGDLRELMRSLRRACASDGLIVFTTERSNDGARFRLMPTGRYSHNPDWIRELLVAEGLEVGSMGVEVLRTELGRPVEGTLVVARPASQ
jgi:predicted TPR repeat methyltransferase